MLGTLVQFFGFLLIALALIDVFLTVLYARIGTGIATPYLAYGIWRTFRAVSVRLPRKPRDLLLTAAAPVMLVSMVVLWVCALAFGAALIFWPALGHQIRSTLDPTPTDFGTALYYSASATTTVGLGELTPHTTFYRLVTGAQSFLGMSIITLTITYLLEIYTTLERRNAFALSIHHQTSSTGDAVELVRGLGAAGSFEGARESLDAISKGLIDVYESHHVFWIVTYFRFKEPYYALARLTLVTMETATLIRSALNERRYAPLIQSGGITELWQGGMHLLREFANVFLPKPPSEDPESLDPHRILLWRMRYREAIMKLSGAGIETAEDPIAGEEEYIRMRREWDRYIRAFGDYMAHSAEEIDPAGVAMAKSVEHYPIEPARLRAAG